MQANGYSHAAITTLWDTLVPFSDYAFNKAHTAAYGMVSYWTAYLKANSPRRVHGRAAHIGSRRQRQDGGLPQRVPSHGNSGATTDVNESAANFTPVGADIRFGLTAVRNVGHNGWTESLPLGRHAGKAVNFHGFLDQVPLVVCNKRVIESLIKAGAFESMGVSPVSPDERLRGGGGRGARPQTERGATARMICSASSADTDPVPTGSVPDLPDWDKRTKLAFEREMLGLYVSDHPLQGLEHILRRRARHGYRRAARRRRSPGKHGDYRRHDHQHHPQDH